MLGLTDKLLTILKPYWITMMNLMVKKNKLITVNSNAVDAEELIINKLDSDDRDTDS